MGNTEGKKIGKMAALYGLVNLLNGIMPLLFIPILTRYLGKADYGMLANFEVFAALMMPVITLDMHAAIMRQYYEKDVIDFPQYVTNCIGMLLVSTLVLGALMMLFRSPILSLGGLPGDIMLPLIGISFGEGLVQIALILWQVERKPLLFGSFRILQTAVNFSLSLYFVIGLNLGWQGRVQALTATSLAFGILALLIVFARGYFRPVFSVIHIRHALSYGLPLIPHNIGGIIRTMTDRFFITAMVGIESTGLYAVGYQVGKIIGFVESAFNTAWVPWFFEQLKKNDEAVRHHVVRLSYIYMGSLLVLAILFSLLAPVFMKVFVGQEFQGSGIYVIWIAVGFAFSGMYKTVCNYLFFVGKTQYLSMVTMTTAVLNIGLNYLMISSFGALGAAQTTTITLAISFVMTWAMAQRFYKMPWLHFFKKKDPAA